MAITDKQVRGGNGIKYTKEVTNSGDYAGLANNTYFKDLSDGLIYWKDTTGEVRDIFGKRYVYEISFNEVLDVLQRFTVDTNITAITAYNVATLKYSINDAADVTVTLPFAGTISLTAGQRIVWKITYTTGTLAVLNLTATEL